MNRVSDEPGFLLHRRDYRESSLLLELFTLNHGRVGVVARGARRSRQGRSGLLQPFQPLLLGWAGRGELGTLTEVDRGPGVAGLVGSHLPYGFYLNELLMRLLPRDDPHPQLFHHYREALQSLAGEDATLRRFEVVLLQELGYGLELTCDGQTGQPLDPDGHYRYELEKGPCAVADAADSPWVVSGATLLALAKGEIPRDGHGESRRLMSRIMAHYLGDRPIRSRELLKKNWRRR
ncbi:MAG: DNA repair protein RecO [Xanthomonadales bacterium]|nr:DNA repair protein RecO [Xanthomonadales bacterium]